MNVITDFNKIDRLRWQQFIDKYPLYPFFQTPEMFEVYRETENAEPVVIAIENEFEMLGVLIAVIQKESPALAIFTSRSVIIGGPVITDNSTDVLDKILTEYSNQIKKKAIYSQFRNFKVWSSEEVQVFKKNGFSYEQHLDIIHDLRLSPDSQLMKMHAGRRKNIRRAEKINLVFREATDLDEFMHSFQLVVDTYKKIKLPLPPKLFFRKIYKNFYAKGFLKIFVVENENEIIAIRMVLCFSNLIYDWYAGSDENHLDKYPNDYLPWKIMEWGHLNNYKYFDFGGAGKPDQKYGVRDYKLKFGGQLVEYGRFILVHKPFLMKLGTWGLKLYQKIK